MDNTITYKGWDIEFLPIDPIKESILQTYPMYIPTLPIKVTNKQTEDTANFMILAEAKAFIDLAEWVIENKGE